VEEVEVLDQGGGGGAGGFRESSGANLQDLIQFPFSNTRRYYQFSTTTYPITVGAGGTGGKPNLGAGNNGSNSVFSTITSTGGGGGGVIQLTLHQLGNGNSGGSGGGQYMMLTAKGNR
jgi:hypothetical protein